MSQDESINKHYGLGKIFDKIVAGLNLAGKHVESLSIDDLAPIDEFHTRGRDSTDELLALAKIQPSELVLDVGCGLGGSARHIWSVTACKVEGIDLTEEYVEVASKLNDLIGLKDGVHFQQGSALELPFNDAHFDLAWTEHVQMNIANKDRFYSEIYRVLKPGGRLVFHDVFRGTSNQDPVYPVPWADRASLSHLATESDVKTLVEGVGFKIETWQGKVKESVAFFQAALARIEESGLPPIGIHLLMGENSKDKVRNYIQNLSERRTSVAMGLLRK